MIAIRNIIILAKKYKNKKRLLIIKNVNKTIIEESAKVFNIIKLSDKYDLIISNSIINLIQ